MLSRPTNGLASKRLGFWHLGADGIGAAPTGHAPSERVRRAMAHDSLLMVGTIEPRKNHALALDAMEHLWARGNPLGLVIAGKPGWMFEKFLQRVSAHPQLGNRLHYIERPSDNELAYCYARASGLLFPTAGEGFGLPLIEAAEFGTPILASNLPVLREIGGERVTYFTLSSAIELATAIEDWLRRKAEGTIMPSSEIPRLTWEQSAEQLLNVILDDCWYKACDGRR